jgi:Mg2+-importing ATPase
LDEIPYDFIRKRLSIQIAYLDHETATATGISNSFIVSKGALYNILEVCSYAETGNEHKVVDLDKVKQQILDRYHELSNRGYRLLGVCYRNIVHIKQDNCSSNNIPSLSSITKDDEINMIFLGFLIFVDPIKDDVIESIDNLKKMGISLKIISGDNRNVATYVAREIGLENPRFITGSDLHHMSKDALIRQTLDIDVYAEIEPNQKEQIILALRHSGKNVVGYMGDGINDASALHAADAGISVDSAADVVKEAADFVLLEKDLGVLAKGVQEGRRTFANTLKYIFMATSANFGNMFSMAGASLFLPFLPLLPKQVLLMNLLTDLPEMTISTDNVDQETVEKPRHWDIKFIRKFMIVFGLISTIFDYATFAVLLFVLHSTINQFRTAWFTESVISASIVVLVIRTRKPMFKSKPSKYLLFATLLIITIVITIPFVPFSQIFGFTMLNASYLATITVIVLLYIITAELTKKIFYKMVKY